jgi:hypothetical protein
MTDDYYMAVFNLCDWSVSARLNDCGRDDSWDHKPKAYIVDAEEEIVAIVDAEHAATIAKMLNAEFDRVCPSPPPYRLMP